MKENNTDAALRMLAVHHKEFIKAVKSIAGNHINVKNYAEDYVQEGYLRLSRYDDLYDRIVKNGKVTKGYMFFALRSIVINDIKKRTNLDFNHVGDEYDFEEKFMHIDEGVDKDVLDKSYLEDKIYEILDEKAHWFDAQLFRTYMDTRKSFQTLANETGLGVQTIYLSIKKSKLLIAENLHEDYKDYINGILNNEE